MKSRSRTLDGKSIASMLSAIEIYNKPDFKYREETFAILSTNAWELLLKARILQLADNKLSSIVKYERRVNKDKTLSKKKYRSKNRSGNFNTIGLFKAYDILINEYGDKIQAIVRKNLEALVEVRDNSVHFMNKDFTLSKKIHEIGTASIRNYIQLRKLWFGLSVADYDIFLMPIGFVSNISGTNAIAISGEEKRLIEYIAETEKQSKNPDADEYAFALNIDVKFNKVSKSKHATEVRITNDDGALPVQITEEDIREKYPWDYGILTTRLVKRYVDFKQNHQYHKMRKKLEKQTKYCKIRLLDPSKPNSLQKKFYNPNIVKEFDRHYRRRK